MYASHVSSRLYHDKRVRPLAGHRTPRPASNASTPSFATTAERSTATMEALDAAMQELALSHYRNNVRSSAALGAVSVNLGQAAAAVAAVPGLAASLDGAASAQQKTLTEALALARMLRAATSDNAADCSPLTLVLDALALPALVEAAARSAAPGALDDAADVLDYVLGSYAARGLATAAASPGRGLLAGALRDAMHAADGLRSGPSSAGGARSTSGVKVASFAGAVASQRHKSCVKVASGLLAAAATGSVLVPRPSGTLEAALLGERLQPSLREYPTALAAHDALRTLLPDTMIALEAYRRDARESSTLTSLDAKAVRAAAFIVAWESDGSPETGGGLAPQRISSGLQQENYAKRRLGRVGNLNVSSAMTTRLDASSSLEVIADIGDGRPSADAIAELNARRATFSAESSSLLYDVTLLTAELVTLEQWRNAPGLQHILESFSENQ